MADGGEAFDAYPGALAARRAADPENLAKVLEFRRALRAGCAYGGAALVPVLHADRHGSERPMKPHVIGMERSPAASAASLCRRDKLDFNHAISIWLRYMLDFEKNTWGRARRFVDAAAFCSAPATAADCDLLPMALEVQSLLPSRETCQTRDRPDGIAAAFNTMAQALYEEMVLRELGHCLHDHWELDATRARFAEVEQSLQHQRAPQI